METTFITIHDLSPEGRILYSSDSIVDILGYTPDEVLRRSCWDFFHPNELPFARELHSRGVKLDKAAVLSYCQLRNRQSQWVCCECCFTIVYDVMVVCTSIYRRGMVSHSRATQAPVVRRLFSSSPKDPRYHMLSHLSSKFSQREQERTHEPRAALFLNRFTRTLTIMYATAGVEKILGISGDDMKGRSFYYCIQEDCLDDAVRCLESAKANDSIAYLRFWFRDPRSDDPSSQDDTDTGAGTDTDVSMTDATSDALETDWEEGTDLGTPRGFGSYAQSGSGYEQSTNASNSIDAAPDSAVVGASTSVHSGPAQSGPNSTSGASRTPWAEDSAASSDQASRARSGDTNHSSDDTTSVTSPESPASSSRHRENPGVELEAVISCTSDGLVVCLRRARPVVPTSVQRPAVHQQAQKTGIFAAPWATNPIFSPARPNYQYWPMQAHGAAQPAMPGDFPVAATGFGPPPQGPSAQALFDSIRDTAIFAWALTSINGSLADYATNPHAATGESQPADGLPVWEGADNAYGGGQVQHHGSNDSSGSDSGYGSMGRGKGNGAGHGQNDCQPNGEDGRAGDTSAADPRPSSDTQNGYVGMDHSKGNDSDHGHANGQPSGGGGPPVDTSTDDPRPSSDAQDGFGPQ